jgi:hypothetical protein
MCAPSVLYAAGLNTRSDDGGIVALTTVATLFKMVQEFKSSERRPSSRGQSIQTFAPCGLNLFSRGRKSVRFNNQHASTRARNIGPSPTFASRKTFAILAEACDVMRVL